MAERITEEPMSRGEMLRDESNVIITTSWLMKLSANGCDDFDNQARKKEIPVEAAVAGIGVDVPKRLLYLYAEPPGTTGAVAITRYKAVRNYTLSAARAFRKYSQFQFDVRRQFPIVPGQDDEGLDCLIISLDNFTERPVRPVKTKTQSAD